ncbi:metallophosphoesterase, partial [Polaribacter sp.]|uniref:bifunctional metallophosphatase/5'-nucleotidase n=1 Tax=Polaribacter sp. TaxID=1920175 RepID=UPI002622BF0C
MNLLLIPFKRIPILLYFLAFQCATFAQETIVIFAINDPHSEIENFAKIKPLIDAEKAKNQKVYFVAGGDLFSGNPIVDYHQNKGYPMIDMLNKTGLDVSVIGNHEFDYGQAILNDRLEQANFPFICDNVSGGTGKLGDIQGSTIITKDDFSIAFVGVVETGSPGGYPLTHPKKIQGLSFTEGLDSFENYKDLKVNDNVDLIVALTHYGSYKDEEILETYNFVDLVIGGHNNQEYGVAHANGYKVMSGVNLEKISKTTLTVTNKQITNFEFELINLSNSNLALDNALAEDIDGYFNNPSFYTNIGSSVSTLTKTSTGCFYTDALQIISDSDMVIQNFGGIRDKIYEGIITPFSIYSIDPFGNGFDTYTMSVTALRNFLNEYPSSFSYSLDTSFKVSKNQNNEFIFFKDDILLQDSSQITLSLNDYISSVYPNLFPTTPSYSFPLTTADYLIEYLTNHTDQPIDYLNCNQRNNT